MAKMKYYSYTQNFNIYPHDRNSKPMRPYEYDKVHQKMAVSWADQGLPKVPDDALPTPETVDRDLEFLRAFTEKHTEYELLVESKSDGRDVLIKDGEVNEL